MNLIRPRTDKRAVINEETGRIGGFQIEHWDGRLDALVTPHGMNIKFVPTATYVDDNGLILPRSTR